MARSDPEPRLQDRTARARLLPRAEPYWRVLFPGAYVGYYRGAKRGTWMARVKVGRSYAKKRLAIADDDAAADGIEILSWKEALDAAWSWAKSQAEGITIGVGRSDVPAAPVPEPEEERPRPAGGKTVEDAIAAYIAMRDERASERAGRPVKSDAHRLNRHVGSHAVFKAQLATLLEDELRAWLKEFKPGKRTTKLRSLGDFKAALNLWYEENRASLGCDFPVVVKYGLKLGDVGGDEEEQDVARENQILSDAQVRKLITAAAEIDSDGDVGRMVLVLAATGARFSQVMRMKVRDVQAAHSRLLIPPSRKGKSKPKGLIRVKVDQTVIDSLTPAIIDRPGGAPLLERWRHRQIGPILWERTERGPWTSSAELTRFWTKVLKQAGIAGIVPYALRHSSIVRGLRVGLPIRLVAALHDTSVAMIEKHYSRWITDGLEEMASLAAISLDPSP